MAGDVLAGRWKEVKGQMKIWWGDLTDDDVDKIAGNKDKLIGKLQARYGWERAKAENEINRRLRDYEEKHRAA